MDRLTRPDLAPPGTRVVNMNQLAEALAGELPGPPVRALYVYNCNPAAVAPDQRKVLEGLMRDDLFTVVHEQFPTDTVDYADIVLPATTQLEHVDIHGSYGHHFVMLNAPAIAPRGEARSNNDVFRALAARLGFEPDLFPDDETLIREALDGGPTTRGITLERLREEPSIRLDIPERYAPFADGRLPHPVRQVRAVFRADARRRPRPPARPTSRPGKTRRTRPDLAESLPDPAPEPAPPAVPQLDLRQLPEPPPGRRRPDRRAVGRGRRRPGAGRRPVGRGLQRPGRLPGPGRPHRRRPARGGRRHRPLLEQARPRRAATPTARPPPP